MLDALLGAIELVLVGLLELFPSHRKIIVALIFGLAIVWAGTGAYRFLNRHENLVADVSDFNSSTNGPLGSYLRVTNVSNTGRQAFVTIDILDSSGTQIGSFETNVIAPRTTIQFSALQIENEAEVPQDKRVGVYFFHITGKFEGTVQHLLFDGNTIVNSGGVSYRR